MWVEGLGFRRIEEGQQGVWGGAVGVSAPVREGADGTVRGATVRLRPRTVRLYAIIQFVKAIRKG